ncbi:MAG: MBL fold metallo-hydrolase, partial [Candidatus Hodarchaeota archaeon]
MAKELLVTILNLVSSKQNSETREITFNNIRYVTTMKIIILGSGGGTEIPRPFCQCRICQEAMKKGIPYSRNALAVYIEDLKALLETPEDISDSLTRWEIRDVDYIFLSHWHPDHTFGLRPVLQAYYDWN